MVRMDAQCSMIYDIRMLTPVSVGMIPVALALYEYIITFDREVETAWRRKFTFPTVLWFLVSALHIAFSIPLTTEPSPM